MIIAFAFIGSGGSARRDRPGIFSARRSNACRCEKSTRPARRLRALLEHIEKIIECARATRRDYRNRNRRGNFRGQFAIEAAARAVAVDRGEQNFSRAAATPLRQPISRRRGPSHRGRRACRLPTNRPCASRRAKAPRPARRIAATVRKSVPGASTAAVFTVTLSAPARSTARPSSIFRMPPPAVSGIFNCSATRRIVSRNVARPSFVALMSSTTSSSAPSRL